MAEILPVFCPERLALGAARWEAKGGEAHGAPWGSQAVILVLSPGHSRSLDAGFPASTWDKLFPPNCAKSHSRSRTWPGNSLTVPLVSQCVSAKTLSLLLSAAPTRFLYC